MPKVKSYHLKATARIPNSHLPLLHYPGFWAPAKVDAGKVYDEFEHNGWEVQWIYRYGSTQPSHYHSTAHECMAVLSGQATIRFGAADISSDLEDNTYGTGFEDGGVEVHVTAGDVFVIPAGVAHKTFNTTPAADFSLLTPGQGSGIEAEDQRQAVAGIVLDGFTMLGAYPTGSKWDFQTGVEAQQPTWSNVWSTPLPKKDPVVGTSSEGLCGLWQCATTTPRTTANDHAG